MSTPDTQAATPAQAPRDGAPSGPVAVGTLDAKYLTFALNEEIYGVPIALVTEIVGMQRIMSVPDVPHFIKGVINLRGKVIPLMDVRLRFGIPERAYDDRTVVVVMEVDGAPVGLIVDSVREVAEIPDDQIDNTTAFGSADRPSAVAGLGRMESRVAILLNARVLVTDMDLSLPETADA